MKYLGLLLIFIAGTLPAQELFPDLEYTVLGRSCTLGYIDGFELNIMPCTELPTDDIYYCDEVYEAFSKVGTYQLDASTEIALYFTEGPSDDPELIVVRNNKDIVLQVLGNQFYFRGNVIYVSGFSNSLFDKRRKFKYEGGFYRETPQPYYAVGLAGDLNRNITIYASQDLTEPVAVLPEGYYMEIVAIEYGHDPYKMEQFILVRTKFGLLGWMKLEEGDWWGGLIDDLRFHGD